MSRTIRSVAIAAALCATAGITVGFAGAAAATTSQPDTLSGIQARAAAATSTRISALQEAIPKISANTYINSADRAEILNTLNNDLAAMQTLAAKIAADNTVAQARADYLSIFTNYRVLAVALPQSRYAAAADDMTDSALPKLAAAYTALKAALSGPDSAKDTPQLNADLSDMTAKIAAAADGLNGAAANALAVTPADFDANHAVLQPVRDAVEAAMADAHSARADANAILAALKS